MSLKDSFRGLYRLCQCGCGELIPIINTRGNFSRFKQSHNVRIIGINNHNFKSGRTKSGDGKYWILSGKRGYPGADKYGNIYEHIYVYQEYHKVCLLKGIEIHHINGDGFDNSICNLQALTKRQHRAIELMDNKRGLKDMSGFRCSNCGSDKTYMRKVKMGLRPKWKSDSEGNRLCCRCYKRWCRRKNEVI